jgi:hypothetical protein
MSNEAKTETGKILSRRGLLVKLGLAATAAYVAPVMLQLGEAKASSFSGGRRRVRRVRRARRRGTRRASISFSR